MQMETLARINTVPLKNHELYFLRLLLMHVRGPTCFTDLKIYEGQVEQTYRDACNARNLLRDDQEWIRVMSDAVKECFAPQIRTLLLQIFINCDPSRPAALFEKFQSELSDDFINKNNPDKADAEKEAIFKALLFFERKLATEGISMESLGLDTAELNEYKKANSSELERIARNRYVQEELDYNSENQNIMAQNGQEKLHDEQQALFNRVMQMVEEQKQSQRTTHYFFGSLRYRKNFRCKRFTGSL